MGNTMSIFLKFQYISNRIFYIMSKTNTDKMVEITLPKLGESISEATVLDWLVKMGDAVEKDQTILEVSTDKVDSEIPAPYNGTITEIVAHSDEVVKVGAVLGRMEVSEDQSTPKSTKKSPKKPNKSTLKVPNPLPVQKNNSRAPLTGDTVTIQ